jgi:transcriptional antiterminator NusG
MASHDGTGSGEACPRWYAVRVRSNHEKRVQSGLSEAGSESFLPVYAERSRWSDRVRTIERPLFPGYLFVRLGLANGHAIPQIVDLLRVPGVIQILPANLTPQPVAEHELESVRLALAAKVPLAACDYAPGQSVKVERGPLKGAHGVVVRANGAARLVITMTMLQRSVCVRVDASDIAPDTSTQGKT